MAAVRRYAFGPAAVAVALLAASPACTGGRDGVPAAGYGWRLEFADDFDGPAGTLPSADRWRFSIGHGYPGGPPDWGTGEVAYHTDDPANVSVDGEGNLRITPLRDRAGDWTSARIETHRQDFRPPPGGALRIESRLRIPATTGEAALGYWPAFWALGSPYRGDFGAWPAAGEIDIMENVNGVDTVWGTLHCSVEPGGPCGAPDGLGGSRPCPDAPCPGAFHRFTFEWDTRAPPHQLRWSVDGEAYHAVSRADIPPDAWDGFTGHAGYFLILNLAIGGGFPDAIAGRPTPVPATEPGHPLVVDYIAVWSHPPPDRS
jgi:hypothetical protein